MFTVQGKRGSLRNAGFTLLEIMCVSSVCGAMGAPSVVSAGKRVSPSTQVGAFWVFEF